MKKQSSERVAIVYDRVNKWGGAERVLLALHELFPNADLITSVYSKEGAKWADVFPTVKTSFINRSKYLQTRHYLIPYLMPAAFESLDFNGYKTIISVTSEAAKGIITESRAKHICYCLTPTRYLWSGYETYFRTRVIRDMLNPVVSYMKQWDKIAAYRPDEIVTISTAVQKRIMDYYNRDSRIVFPPIDDIFFSKPLPKRKDRFYLVVSRLVPYKKTEIAVKAFTQMNKELVVVGEGSELRKLTRMAGPKVKFVGKLTDLELLEYYRNSKALVFPQDEDFGLTAVEAQASGTPVIAFKSGGALDSVIDEETGILFDLQTVESLIQAIEKFEKTVFEPKLLRTNAKRFSKETFYKNFARLVK